MFELPQFENLGRVKCHILNFGGKSANWWMGGKMYFPLIKTIVFIKVLHYLSRLFYFSFFFGINAKLVPLVGLNYKSLPMV